MLALIIALSACASAEPEMPGGTTAERCGACHVEQYAQWRSSAHARSATSPVFEALLPRVEASWGEGARAACESCHAPGHGGDEAIGCVSCHAAVGNTAEHSGRLIVDLSRPIAGPSGEAPAGAPHAVRSGDFLASESLCGTCHEVRGPGLFEEPTLTEWRESGLSAIGAGCASCHVSEGSHRFVGLDPPWDASEAEVAEAAERSRALLEEALALWIELGDGAAVITVENAGAGHAVPTGVSFLRDIWVDVRVVAADGTSVTRERVIELGARAWSGDREVALVTSADRIEPRGLGLGEHRTVEIALPYGTARIEATLRARAIRADVLDALELGHRASEVPVLEVATVSAAPSPS